MKVLVTGADGMVARAVIRHCSSVGDSVVALNRSRLDISDSGAVKLFLGREKPDAVINCAAYTDVDGAENEPDLCYAVNAAGVENLASSASSVGAAFVTISTDYVFDGKKEGFYTQDDEPNPLGVYAASKLAGERLAAAANPSAVIVRSGWIFGRGGTNFLSVMHRLLAEGRRITAIDDAFGTPTFGNDLAGRLRELAERPEPGIYHVVNSGDGTSYLGFAHAVCEKGGFDKGLVTAVSDSELKRAAARPKNSRLACLASARLGFAPLPDWKDAVNRFLSD